MDFSFSNLRRLRYTSPAPSNNTSVTNAQVPNILDAFIPGYTFFCKLVRDEIGYDVSNLVFTFFAVLAVATSLRYLVNTLGALLSRYGTAAVTVDSSDFIYDCILAWAADHPTLREARSLHVRSVPGDFSVEGLSVLIGNGSAEDIFKEKDCAANNANHSPHYDIYMGPHWFRHEGRFFRLAREDQQGSGVAVDNREKLTLTVLGRSTKPIKDLIVEARNKRMSRHVRKGDR